MTLPHRSPLALLLLFAGCVGNIAASAGIRGWQQLLTHKVIACGAAALALFVISLLLRGFLKLVSLALVIVLAAGAFWFLREAWENRAELLPQQWNEFADKTLDNPKTRAVWRSVQDELSGLSSGTRNRIAAGTDDARRTVLTKLEAKARDLRKAGSKAEAEQIERLAALIREGK